MISENTIREIIKTTVVHRRSRGVAFVEGAAEKIAEQVLAQAASLNTSQLLDLMCDAVKAHELPK